MNAEELLSIINECDVLRDDIEDVRARLPLSKTEGSKLAQATACVDKAKSILTVLFPGIKALHTDVREDLEAELCEL
jgi:hypothetical protein